MGQPLHTAMALNPGANHNTNPTYSTKVCFMAVGNITSTANKGKRAEPMSDLFLYMSMCGQTLKAVSLFQVWWRSRKNLTTNLRRRAQAIQCLSQRATTPMGFTTGSRAHLRGKFPTIEVKGSYLGQEGGGKCSWIVTKFDFSPNLDRRLQVVFLNFGQPRSN